MRRFKQRDSGEKDAALYQLMKLMAYKIMYQERFISEHVNQDAKTPEAAGGAWSEENGDLKSDIYSTNNRVWTQRMLKEYRNLRKIEAGEDTEDGPVLS